MVPTLISLAFHRELVATYRARRATGEKIPDPLR
jgi:hypothetical protein